MRDRRVQHHLLTGRPCRGEIGLTGLLVNRSKRLLLLIAIGREQLRADRGEQGVCGRE